jgi:PAS domain-containing protein
MQGKIIFVSPSVYPLTGYTVDEATGSRMAEEVYAEPKVREQFLAEIMNKGYIKNFEAVPRKYSCLLILLELC